MMMRVTTGGQANFAGGVGLEIRRPQRSLRDIPQREWGEPTLMDLMRSAVPLRGFSAEVNQWRRGNLRRFFGELWRIALARKLGTFHMFGALYLDVHRPHAPIVHLGLAGLRSITDAGVAFLVDAWQNIVELEIMKYHALGTGTTGESATHTALVTELTTEYTGNVRATGSLTEGATANIFRSVGTNTLDGTPGAALREHMLMSQAAIGGGVGWDRTLYGAITLISGESLTSTYDMTAGAGT